MSGVSNITEIPFPSDYRLEPLNKDVDSVFKIYNSKGIAFHGIAKRCRSQKCLLREMNTLNKLSGIENIPFVYYYFRKFDENKNIERFYLVISKLPGKDLFSTSMEMRLTENEIADIIFKLLNILKQIHARGVIHGDLKLENVIYCPIYKDVGLIDFDGMQTYKYNAPETMKRLLKDEDTIYEDDFYKLSELSPKIDTWGVGMICYLLFEYRIPFNNGEDILFKKIEFSSKTNSEDAKNFIEMCLRKDKEIRPTIEDCLKHKWLNTIPISNEKYTDYDEDDKDYCSH
jgi:serine/threonine protein kinase